MIILLHSSKTMISSVPTASLQSRPVFMDEAYELIGYLRTLSLEAIMASMHVSRSVAEKSHHSIQHWGDAAQESSAMFSFVGDIYSGLQAHTFTEEDVTYAQEKLRILSGLYGVLRPLDSVQPYRLEMGYRFPDPRYKNLYTFWNDKIASTLPSGNLIINTSSVEYSRTVTPYIDPSRVITPQFFTISPKTGHPTFVTVHTKIARGAFAHWLIKTKQQTISSFTLFDELGYHYDAKLSLPNSPAFVCEAFGGLGLSVRLQR